MPSILLMVDSSIFPPSNGRYLNCAAPSDRYTIVILSGSEILNGLFLFVPLYNNQGILTNNITS